MTRADVMTVAKQFDADAVWATDEFDENCILVTHATAPKLLALADDAWEDPNPEGVPITRIVFPSLAIGDS